MNEAAESNDLIADGVARLFAGQVDKGVRERAEAGTLDAALWQRVSDSGWPLLLASESAGGPALDWTAAHPVLRALGYWQVPLPLAETMVAAQLLSCAGLPVPDGPLTLIEQGHGNRLTVRDDGGMLRVSGLAHGVPWARHASAAVLSLGASGQLALLELRDAAGVGVQPHDNVAALPADTLRLDDARCVARAANPLPLPLPAWTLGAVARCAMMAGALEWTLEQAVRHAGERVQFGKPIGRNQALQQNLALAAGDVAAARIATLVATADLPAAGAADGHAGLFSAAVAKVRCGEAATRVTGIAHQVHGAIGFTREHALHFATRRLWAWRAEFGSDAWWAGELGRAAIAAGAQGFWPGLTGKNFELGL